MCCDTKNIICQERMLVFALTSLHVLASWGICHGMTTAGRQIPLACAQASKQTARSRGQERSGHHAADSSDLFLISVMRAYHTDHVAC